MANVTPDAQVPTTVASIPKGIENTNLQITADVTPIMADIINTAGSPLLPLKAHHTGTSIAGLHTIYDNLKSPITLSPEDAVLDLYSGGGDCRRQSWPEFLRHFPR